MSYRQRDLVPPAVREQIYACHLRGWTLATIVKRLGVDASYARAIITRMQSKTNLTRLDADQRQQIADAYGRNVSRHVIAKQFGVSSDYVRSMANHMGVRRSKKAADAA